MEWTFSLYVTTLPGLVTIGIFNSGDRPYGSSNTGVKTFYGTLQYHVIKGSGDFMEENSSLFIPTLTKLVAIDIVLMDI